MNDRQQADQLPPHDLADEMAALKCVLESAPADAPGRFAQLEERHFYGIQPRAVFRAMTRLEADHRELNEVELQTELKNDPDLREDAGGDTPALQIQIPSPANFPSYLDRLNDLAARRAKIAAAKKEIADARNFKKPLNPPQVAPGSEVKPPEAKPLGELKRRSANDPSELIRTGYLCRGGTLLIAAPTGIGKSALSMQAMILWAIGRDFFGITPARPLKSLLIQAENDDGDLAEMRDGVISGLGLTEDEKALALKNVVVVHENTRTGGGFFDYTVAPLLKSHRPDLLWIDPALAYIGGDASAQKDVGGFLRNLLNPLLTRFNCGCVIIHHTNKPSKGEEKGAWQAGDFAYLGSGSGEWANHARAVLAIRSRGSHDVFELRAGKRGTRIGWKTEDGKPDFARLIGHATEPGVICWRTASEDETPGTATKRPGTPEDLTALVPLEKPIAKTMLLDKWKDRFGNHEKGRAFLDDLVTNGKLHVWTQKRPGTNPAKLIARNPQPEPQLVR